MTPKGPLIISEKGFTLLELIVAVTLVALMAVALWSVFRISVRSWSRGTEFIDANQRHRNILDMVRKQIASTYGLLAPVDPSSGMARYPIFNGTDTSLRFISLNSLQFQDNPGLTLVDYEVTQNSQGEFSLIEKEGRYLNQIPDQEESVGQGRAISIFGNLVGCSFQYFDPGDNDNPSQWVKEWDGQKIGRLPVAIAMSMIYRDPKGSTQNRYLVVPIRATANGLGMGLNPFGPERARR
jgi:general secretion pathway protein J